MRPQSGPAGTLAALQSGLDSLGIEIDAAGLAALETYLALLTRWNAAYNLTAVRDPREMVTRHLLDSLAVAPLLPASARRLIDVGTGAGLPGVPLAIAQPDRHFDLLDSNGKKSRFLFQVKTELGLSNMAVCQGRVENWQPVEPYDAVLSRAFASLADMAHWCAHLCRPQGLLLAMKGQYPEAEIEELPATLAVKSVESIDVPGLGEERHLVVLQQVLQH